jgi:hypothetical protein
MGLYPPFGELHLCVTSPGPWCPSSVNVAPLIQNTDLSFTTISPSSVVFAAANDGGAQSTVATANSSGTVTAVNPGWANVTITCTTCAAGGSLPTITIPAKVYATIPTFNTFTHCGQIATSYVPSSSPCSSFWPNPMWQQTLLLSTPYYSASNQEPWIPNEMQEANINSTFEGATFPSVSSPKVSSCTAAGGTNNSVLQYLQSAAVAAGTYFQLDVTTLTQEFDTGVIGFGAFLQNSDWNRQLCYQQWVQQLVTNGRTFALEGLDEVNQHNIAGLGPGRSGIMGQSSVDSGFNVDLAPPITSNGSGACTATVNMSFYAAWNQTTGTGDGITIINATSAGLNGFHLVRSTVPTGTDITQATSLMFDCTAASGTYNSTTDPTAQLVYFYTGALSRTGILPAVLGSATQGTSTAQPVQLTITAASNGNPSSFTVSSPAGSPWLVAVPPPGSSVTISGFSGNWAPENGTCGTVIVVSQNTFKCTTINGSPVNASTFGTTTGSPVSTTPLTSLVASSGTLTVNWAGHRISSGTLVQIRSATNTNLHTIAPISNVTTNTFTVPTLAADGTYNSSTDPNLYIIVDPGFTNQTLSVVASLTRAVNGPTINYAPIGSPISNTEIAYRWLGDPNALDAGMTYVAQGATPIYGTGGSVSQTANSHSTGLLNDRAYILEPHRPLVSVGMTYAKMCLGYVQPACGDQSNNALIRPESLLASFGAGVIWGAAGDFIYNYEDNPFNIYTGYPIGSNNAGAFAIASQTTPVTWNAMANFNALMKRLEPFYLQPRINTPYFGPALPATAHQNSTNTARLLVIACQNETPYPTFTLFDTLGLSYSGGTILKYVVDTRKMVTSKLSAATDAYTGCAGSPGDVTAYIFLGSGTSSPLDNVTFSAPATFPFGSSKMAIRVGYSPRYKGQLTMQDAAATNCTAGCIIPVDHSNADAWYQILYLDSNNLVKGAGDPQNIAKVY